MLNFEVFLEKVQKNGWVVMGFVYYGKTRKIRSQLFLNCLLCCRVGLHSTSKNHHLSVISFESSSDLKLLHANKRHTVKILNKDKRFP